MFLCLPASNFPTKCKEQAACLFEPLELTDHTFNIDNQYCQFPLFPVLNYALALCNYVMTVTENSFSTISKFQHCILSQW